MAWDTLAHLSDVVGVLSTGVELLKWLHANRQSPLSSAFNRTVSEFKEEMPAIKDQLAAFLASDTVKSAVFTKVSMEIPDVRWLAQEFATRGAFFGDENVKQLGADRTAELAEIVVTRFLENLNEVLLTGKDGLLQLDKRETLRHRDTRREIIENIDCTESSIKYHTSAESDRLIASFREALSQSLRPDEQAVLEPYWNKRVEHIKQLSKEAGPKLAIDLWQSVLREVSEPANRNQDLLMEIHVNLASCYWEVGEHEQAREHFAKSYTSNPEHNRGKLNGALAFMIGNKPGIAHELVDDVLVACPADQRAIAVKAQLYLLGDQFREIVTLFQPYWNQHTQKLDLHSDDCCRLLGIALLELRLLDEALSLFEQGLSYDEHDPGLQTLLALALAERVGDDASEWVLTPEKKAQLTRSECLLTAAIQTFEKRGLHIVLSDNLANRAAVRIRLNKEQLASEDAHRAFQLYPTDHTLQKYALLCLASGSVDKSIPHLEAWLRQSVSDSDDLVALLFDSYAVRQDGAALSSMKAFLNSAVDGALDKLPPSAVEAFGEAAIQAHDLPLAESTAALLLSRGDSDDKGFLLRARIKEYEGLDRDAAAECKKAYEFALEKSDKKALYAVARRYRDLGQFEQAVEAFEVLGITHLSPRALIRDFLMALVDSGVEDHEDQILRIASGYREDVGLDIIVAQAELAVLEAREDFGTASDLWRKVLKISTSPHLVVGAARCLFRNSDFNGAKHLLVNQTRSSGLSARDAMLAAQLLDHLLEPNRSLELAYHAWRSEPANAEMNRAYIAVFLRVTHRHKIDLDVGPLGLDMAATVRFDDGDEKTWLIVGERRRLSADELSPASEIGQKLIGHKPGDVLTWATGGGSPTTATVVQVRHKYVWAFQSATTDHPKQFPLDQSFQALSVKEGDFSQLLAILDKQHESTSEAIKRYTEGSLPFVAFAKLLGRNIFETWSTVVEASVVPLMFCLNIQEERQHELRPGEPAEAVVCDALALLSMHRFGLSDHVRSTFSRVIVSQQTVDCLAECKEDLLRFGEQGRGRMGKNEAGYFIHEVPPDRIQADIAFLERILHFCQQYAEVLPRGRQYNDLERKLVAAFGEEHVSPVLLASGISGAVYYSDDARFRLFMINEYKLHGLNTWSLCQYLSGRSTLSDRELSHLTLRLLRAQYRSVPISVGVLLTTALESFDPYHADFTLLIDQLFSKETDVRSALSVVAGFLKQLLVKVHFFDIIKRFIEVLVDHVLKSAGLSGVGAIYSVISQQGMIEVPNITAGAAYIKTWVEKRLFEGRPQG